MDDVPTTLVLPSEEGKDAKDASPPVAWDSSAQRDSRRSVRRKRSKLAAVAWELERRQTASRSVRWTRAQVVSHVLLFLYTLARIVANFCFGTLAQLIALRASLHLFTFCVLDGVLRPLISGLGVYCFLRRNTRFSSKSWLHIWGRRAMLYIAICFADDSIIYQSMATIVTLDSPNLYMTVIFFVFFSYVLANLFQIQITNQKLRVLGFRCLSTMCEVLTLVSVVGMLILIIALVYYMFSTDLPLPFLLMGLIPLGLVVLLQSLCLIWIASMALCCAEREAGVLGAISCLYLNALLALLGPGLSIGSALSLISTRGILFAYLSPAGAVFSMIPTLDVGLQTLFVLLMCGMIGPKGWDRPMETFRKLADLSGFGLAAKRIAFPGKIILSALDCIVSFPGKYSKEWDAAVSSTQQGNGCSLACVFLTDRASGLGWHAENPDTPGRCWCHTIYGELSLDTYLMVIDVHDDTNGPITEEVLAFKRADAAAMGLVLVIKEDQTELEWESELNQALKIAEERCRQNGCRAPWGCSWFEEWRKNVEEAVRLGQKLHVFYFEGKVGRGKLAWPKLCDSMAKEEARRDSGLGASQTAEVAYLEKMGLEYEAHDITDFEAFLRKCHTWASPRVGVHPARVHPGATCAA